MSLLSTLTAYDKSVHPPKGETLTEEKRVYRVQVLTTLLKAGVAISKLDCFREILEAGSFQAY